MIYVPELWENESKKHFITVFSNGYTMPSNGRIIRGGLSGNVNQVGLMSIIINGQENTNKLLIKPAGQQSGLSTWPPIELKEGDVLHFNTVRDAQDLAISLLIELNLNI
jgi:hypothetical protein